MPNCLRRFTIAVSGDFGPSRSYENIKRWIKANGGIFASSITKNVTHMVCSEKHYRQKIGMVKEALRFPHIKIVSFDWLEDTLHHKTPRREKAYLWCDLIETKKKKRSKAVRGIPKKLKKTVKKAVAQNVESFVKGCEDANETTLADLALLSANGAGNDGPENYHIYQDHTGFVYDVMLVREDHKQGGDSAEKYYLKLFESHFSPRCYFAAAKFYRGGISAAIFLAPIASTFHDAFHEFRKFFFLKTRKAWEDRSKNDAVIMAQTETVAPSRVLADFSVHESGNFNQPFIYSSPSSDEMEVQTLIAEQKEKLEAEKVWDEEVEKIFTEGRNTKN